MYSIKTILAIFIEFLLLSFTLFIILLLSIVNFFEVENKSGYFRSTALNLDIWGNVEFRTFWNNHLLKEKNNDYFGKQGETISSVLGKNILKNNLTNTGKVLVWILTRKHCIDAINTNIL